MTRPPLFTDQGPKVRIALYLFLAVTIVLASCAKSRVKQYSELIMKVKIGDYPGSVAVLPFENRVDVKPLMPVDRTDTDAGVRGESPESSVQADAQSEHQEQTEKEIEEELERLATLVRESFYSHISLLPYRDLEPAVVDQRIGGILDEPETPTPELTRRLGRILGVDAVVFGEVTSFRRVFAGVYSQMAVGASISVWDTRSGREIWADRHETTFHEGGVPLNPLSIPFVTFRTGMNLREKVKVRIVDELARYLAARFPAPETLSEDTGDPVAYEIQVGAFLEKDRAESFSRSLKAEGFPTKVHRNRDDRGLWYKVTVGPYSSSEEALAVRNKLDERLGIEGLIMPVPGRSRSHEDPQK